MSQVNLLTQKWVIETHMTSQQDSQCESCWFGIWVSSESNWPIFFSVL